ncbi:hypothetical protein F3J23_12065 [Chryseobacterium sp. Tr-659]|uniref:hypothetical protein n=1 Tax=Chryseobacterium sp. Tr-659 TaxID=2608340 RepID=UPI001421C3D5|nr:hypothetical protein [Chryseobacterium sp. Tr-659]NIF06176.1 hypothetical protein [Chryseobacterium sp. Tr-659]
MQGIEPKLHMNLTSRIEYYRLLIEAAEDPESRSSDIVPEVSELRELYEDYLLNKKNLEQSIRNYREYHDNLRKRLTVRLRELRRKARQK